MSQPNSPHTSPRKGKYIVATVLLLDDVEQRLQIPYKSYGYVLFDEVCHKLQLLETDYFDLEFTDYNGSACWLDHEKPILKQVSTHNLKFRFLVKFYTPDPGLLEDEYTRYLFALQIRRDLGTNAMPCQEHTGVLLASYIVQAEMGDFLEDEYVDHGYLQGMHILPDQTESVTIKIMEHHKEHLGQSPAEADFNLLDTARKCEMYGIRMHPAKDHEGVPLNLAVAHMGVLVFQNMTRINTFSWAKIRKLSFKRKKFLIKLHPEGYGYYKDTVEFYFDSRNECKNFWKKCIEHHAFFRCTAVKRVARNKTRIVSRGSSFRYSGKTQKQLVEYVRANYTKRPPFERTTSMRTVATSRSTGATPNTSTLNSRDIHFSHGHNTSTSSGSHILDTSSREPLDSGSRLETAEVHDDIVDSGDHSPKKDYVHMGHRDMNHHQHHPAVHDPDVDRQQKAQLYNGRSPRAQRIDPTQFMLSQKDRKFSEPVFSQAAKEQALMDDSHLSRSPEVENIPERVHDTRNQVDRGLRRQHGERASSPTLQSKQGMTEPPRYDDVVPAPLPPKSPPQTSIVEEPLPPPPPPIYQGDYEPHHPELSPKVDREKNYARAKSVASGASGALTSSASVTSSRGTEDSEGEEGRRKRYPADKAYYVAKELLMTERTYKKDLEVITTWFHDFMTKEDILPQHLSHLLFSNLGPIYEFHCSFLKEIEQRLAMWEGKSNAHLNGDYQRIGDIMLNSMRVLQLYRNYLEHHEEILSELETVIRRNKHFEQMLKEFESKKVCYLPLNTFLLKPAQRLLHYKLILERLLSHYTADHPDFKDCNVTLSKIHEVTNSFEGRMKYLENMQKLIELQRDLVGIDTLVQSSRDFIREGCLQKLSRKGYQQRMFFLFSDMLVYTSRTATPSLQFKVHGQLPLRGMIVEETDAKMAVVNSFTIYGGNRCLIVAASSPEEKDKWLEDLRSGIATAKERGEDKIQYPSLKSNSSSDNLEDSHDEAHTPTTPEKQVQHRANTTMHVCWHRNTSVSMRDHNIAIENQLSGYLLRKFKNSNGWQKLWVVFTNFCLFFYKTFQDDFPLASLPLLGYSVTTPSEADGIHKDYVFKLQFKNHVYFFRAESEYTFERWIEVISSATSSAQRTQLLSHQESESQVNSH